MESTEQPEGQNYRAIPLEQGRSERLPARLMLVLEAYLSLIRFDLYIARGNFEILYNKVRNYRPGRRSHLSIRSAGSVRAWIWLVSGTSSKRSACRDRQSQLPSPEVWYIGAPCHRCTTDALQSARLGRSRRTVVNDKQYVPEMYAILTRC